MFIVYVDSDTHMQQRLAETFHEKHRIVAFNELYEAYKWIKHNDIPDMIVTEINVDDSMGLQSLHFLQSKAKLKQTHLVGFTQQPGDYRDLVVSEGARALFAKDELIDGLAAYIDFITAPRRGKTLRDVERVHGKKAAAKALPKRTAH